MKIGHRLIDAHEAGHDFNRIDQTSRNRRHTLHVALVFVERRALALRGGVRQELWPVWRNW